MCTAITYKTRDFYFGRTLDLEYHYSESVTVIPRRYPFKFRHVGEIKEHYSIIGIATVAEGYPLYYDAVNEKGLSVAGLAFWESARYHAPCPERDNIASFELIPWVLSQCATVREARGLLSKINITDAAFSDAFPPSPLHWIISDREGAIVLESVADGLRIYDDLIGVLTNEPPFEYHMTNLNNYINLTPNEPKDRFAEGIDMRAYSRGMGAIGLPGDLSSMSRFVRAAFTKLNSVSGECEDESVGQFFHILDAVSQTRGCVRLGEGKHERMVYTSCANADKGIYYYTTYENRRIVGVDMHKQDLEGSDLAAYPLEYESDIKIVN
jgi:choloylglycine hydrolase